MKKYGDLGPGVVVYALVLALGQQGQADLHDRKIHNENDSHGKFQVSQDGTARPYIKKQTNKKVPANQTPW